MIIEYSNIVKRKYPKDYLQYFNSGKNIICELLKSDYLDNVNENFIDNIFSSDKIKIIFYSNDNKFSMKNNIGIAVYYVIKNTNEIKFYLLLFGINKKYRNLGYGTNFLNQLIEHYKLFNSTYYKRIILHSLQSSYNFYNSFGFTEIVDDKYKYRKLFQYEKYDKNIIILQLNI
jgi:ribosomal protein S18 acetylase RimI-like enzyme